MTEWKSKINPDQEKVKSFTDQLESLKNMFQSMLEKDLIELSKAQMELERLEAQKRNQREKK
jgi:hypothetical protein